MTRFQTRLCAQRGFTLLELLVVVLIIGLLTSVVAPRFLGQIRNSEVITAKAQIDALDKALQAYRIDMGRFPTQSEGLQGLYSAPGDAQRWRGPYLRDPVPPDPWGSPYQYRNPSSRGKDFDLLSLGGDQAAGGTGDGADIVN